MRILIKILFFSILFLILGNNVFSSLTIFNFDYVLQRPSYIIEESKNNYICDEEKEECKINFKLINEEKRDFSNKFKCEIITDFDIGENKNKCNPTTIIIPENTNQKIKFKIYEKDNLSNFKEKEINIQNTFEKKELDFKYELQSPSYVKKKDDNSLACNSDKDECKINFKFLTLSDKEFSSKYDCDINSDFKLPKFSNNCNPTTITIPKNSDHILKIKIFEIKNPNNFIEKEIFIDNTIIHYLPGTKIIVQGKNNKYKKIGYSSMECLTFDKCKVNFTSGKSDSGTYYKWIFGNGKKYYGYNPKTEEFSPGFYKIKLITSNKFGNRKVEIYRLHVKQLLRKREINLIKDNLKKIVKYKENTYVELNRKTNITKNINKKITKKIVKNLNKKKLKKILTVKNIFGRGVKITRKKVNKKKIAKNNKLKKFSKKGINLNKKKILISKKEKLLKKNIKLHISFQKKALKISGQTFAKSKVEIKIGKQKFKTFSNNSGKYVFKINNLIAGKYKILASVYNNKGVLIARKKSREKIISKKYISQLNHYKYKKYLSLVKKKYKKHKKKIKSKLEKYKISILSPPKKEIKLNKFNIIIFIINILIAILISILTSLVLIRKKII